MSDFKQPKIVSIEKSQEAVVLLHGIGRGSRSMKTAAVFLTELGYQVHNIDYPSRSQSIADLSDDVAESLAGLCVSQHEHLHFLTHSMGGIVTKALLKKSRPTNLGRVVMLAPPNQGSEVADFLNGNFFFDWFYGPSGSDLRTGKNGISTSLGAVDFPLGVIAGTKSIDPISSWIISGPDDGKVSVENTKIDGMADHMTLPVNHTFIMQNKNVLRQAAFFFRNGSFERVKS